MENKISLARKIALTGALSALVVVLSVTPLGFISIGAASITILQIPVILAVLLGGLPSGAFVGAVFGIMSLVNAALRPYSLPFNFTSYSFSNGKFVSCF